MLFLHKHQISAMNLSLMMDKKSILTSHIMALNPRIQIQLNNIRDFIFCHKDINFEILLIDFVHFGEPLESFLISKRFILLIITDSNVFLFMAE